MIAVKRRTPAARGERAGERSAIIAEFGRRMDQVLPADMKFENAPMAQVVERLSKATGFEITFSEDTSPGQTFSGDLGNRPFSAALKAIYQHLHGNLIITSVDTTKSGAPAVKISLTYRPRK